MAEFFGEEIGRAFSIEMIIGVMVLNPEAFQDGKGKPEHRREEDQREIEPSEEAGLKGMPVFMKEKRLIFPESGGLDKDEASHRSTAVSVPASDDSTTKKIMFFMAEEQEHEQTNQILREAPEHLQRDIE